MSVAIVGSTVRDVVYLPGREPMHSTGGSPLFAARALAALGVRPGIATRCDDSALAAPIAELAAPLCLRLDANVVQSELRYREDGERDHALASIGDRLERGRHHRLGRAGARATRRWVHAGTQRGGDLGPEVLAALAAGGRCVALDAQGPLRLPQLGPLVLGGHARRRAAPARAGAQAQRARGAGGLRRRSTPAPSARAAACRRCSSRSAIPGRRRRLRGRLGPGGSPRRSPTSIRRARATRSWPATRTRAPQGSARRSRRARSACEHVSALFAGRVRARPQAPA